MEYLIEVIAVTFCFGFAAAVTLGERESSCARIFLCIGMALFGCEGLLSLVSFSVLSPGETSAGLLWAQTLIMAMLPGCWLLFSLTYARGDALAHLRRWRVRIPIAFAALIGSAIAARSGSCEWDALSWPLLGWAWSWGQSGLALKMVIIVACILCLMNLERTLRASVGTMRWRIKYMIVGLGIVLAVRCYIASQAILYSNSSVDMGGLNACALILGSALMYLSVSRGSLNAVDLYPSHGVLYGSLTIGVAATYLLLVGLIAEVASHLGLAVWFPLQTFVALLVLVGCVAILLSDRLKQGIRRFVSRHFRRGQYDYRYIWSRFSQETFSGSDMPTYCRSVTRVIADTLETLSVTIWLVQEGGRGLSLGGSTSLTESEALRLTEDIQLSDEFRRLLPGQVHPVPVSEVPGDLGLVVQKIGQREFANGGEYYCLALAAHEEAFGILVLGDRVGGLPFTIEETDLLAAIGNHLAANLLSVRLSHRLADARKLEAFQTMSAFFIHDLKNMASTLSLMVQNLPKHYDDPAFRQDALKAIGRSAEKINRLIARLSFLRHDLEIQSVEADLNEVAKKAVSGLSGLLAGCLTTEWAPVPNVAMDEEQIQKVIINLLLNAKEASGENGRIRMRTWTADGWVVLSVSDNGCGMSAAFISQKLFKPFQTTKAEGIGIGLFHSRMIIEAHRGRIEVESREGAGSTFSVYLPERKDRA